MKSVLNGPGARLFVMLSMSFAAGALAIVAFGRALRNDSEWMILAGVTVVFLVTIGINAVRLIRKTSAS
jgi:hypothetical protein